MRFGFLGKRGAELIYHMKAICLICLIAFVAQLGERKTEDLKVRGSSPRGGTFLYYHLYYFYLGNISIHLSTISNHHSRTGPGTSGSHALQSPATWRFLDS